MKNSIKNIDDENLEVEVIRYFINNDIKYLIYSLNEIDSQGYTRLYASKIVDNKAIIISDDEEWDLIRQIIKQIVKNNRDGSNLEIIDIDESDLRDITLLDARLFRLQGNLVNLLSENKNFVKSSTADLDDETIKDTTEELNDSDYEKQEDHYEEDNLEETEFIESENSDYAIEENESEESDKDTNYEYLYNELIIENKKLKEENEFLKKYQDKIFRIEEILK